MLWLSPFTRTALSLPIQSRVPFLKRCSRQTIRKQSASSERAEPIRLSKLLAQAAGVSRREAERWILQGDVTMSGQVVRLPHQLITNEFAPGQLQAHGKPVLVRDDDDNNNNNNTRVILVHKMAGELVADSDPQGRPCVMHRLKRLFTGSNNNNKKQQQQHFKAIGRLDMMTEGLLLLTNDGMYARQMEMSNLHRTYRVRVHGKVSLPYLERQLQHHSLYRPMRIVASSSAPSRGKKRQEKSANTWLEITCSEGKNRQVRKVLEQFGLTVTRLIRVGFGDFHLHDIPPGSTLEVPMKPVEKQRRQGSLSVRKKVAPSPPKNVSSVQWVFPQTTK